MTHAKHYRAGLLTTALTCVIAVPGVAQAQALLTEQQLTDLNEECRVVARDYEQPGNDRIVERAEMQRILTENDAARCTEVRQQFTSTEAQTETSGVATEEVQLEEQAVIEGQAQVRVPEPQVDVQEQPAQVRVQTSQPQVQVTEQPSNIQVRQEQPRVSIDVPEISVRIEIPAPSIYVQRAEPDVQISTADPQVEVMQEPPQVTVRQGEPQLAVDLDVDQGAETDDAANTGNDTATNIAQGTGGDAATTTEGNVRLTQAEPQVEIIQPEATEQQFTYQEAAPQITYEQAEPEVIFNMPDQPNVEFMNVGEPNVVFETQAEREARHQQAQAQAQQAQQGEQPAEQPEGQAAANAPQTATVQQLMEMRIVGADGEDVGTPHAFVEVNGEILMVLRDGGFLGLGQKEVAVPMTRVIATDNELRVNNMTADELDNANEFEYDENNRLSDDQQVPVMMN
ncbi:PRC-barrel domain-containing protein [Falsirhodobacter deserti]|uniref:PRC-barrel domain-containing protein n=1 Tax=Falsirhodobacter deserti TaxID=1365611 RepID=UPI000FE4059D|nr:PRC-barrel domain-containing protein [Falsirhodobacter deserti]